MHRIEQFLLSAVLLVLPTAVASAAPCGVDQNNRSVCSVSDGDSSMTVTASSLNGGEFTLRASAGGQTQMIQRFKVYSFDTSEYIDVVLDSATQDAATRQIHVQFTEAFASAIRATAIMTLDDQGVSTVIDESLTFLSLVPFGSSASGRFYIITDYDLNGSAGDEMVQASPGGISITQTDGGTTSTQQVFDPAPSAFDVALWPQLSGPIIEDETLVALARRTSAAGPGDFEYALSWDRSLMSGQSVSAILTQTISVPEPAGWLLSVASLVTLMVVGRRDSHVSDTASRRGRGLSVRRTGA